MWGWYVGFLPSLCENPCVRICHPAEESWAVDGRTGGCSSPWGKTLKKGKCGARERKKQTHVMAQVFLRGVGLSWKPVQPKLKQHNCNWWWCEKYDKDRLGYKKGHGGLIWGYKKGQIWCLDRAATKERVMGTEEGAMGVSCLCLCPLPSEYFGQHTQPAKHRLERRHAIATNTNTCFQQGS